MTGMSDVLTKYLDLAADQMKLTAGNMANLDTPGFKTQGFDFEKEFGAALSGMSARAPGAQPAVGEVDGLVARPDGNTVSIDRESMQMAKAQLQFKTGVALLRGEFSRTMSAIHAESK